MHYPEIKIARIGRLGWLLWIPLLLLQLFACSSTLDQPQALPQKQFTALQNTTRTLDATRGHILFEIDSDKWTLQKAHSVEQQDAPFERLSERQFALVNLVPGTHTLFISAQAGEEKAIAAISSIVVEAGTEFNVGLAPLMKPTAVSGRVIAMRDSSVISGAMIKVRELMLQVQSNSSGEFTLDALPAGRWTLDVLASGAGQLRQYRFNAIAGQKTHLGDLAVGDWQLERNYLEALNAPSGIVREPLLRMAMKFPGEARTFKVVDDRGSELLPRRVVQKNFEVALPNSGLNTIRVIVFDSEESVIGESSFSVTYDPFSDGQSIFVPSASVAQRALVSPQRSFSVVLPTPPAQAVDVRIGIKGSLSLANWMTAQAGTYTVTVPRKNAFCGRNEISIQYRSSQQLLSQELLIPVTLSCWERIPQRAPIEKMVGVENAAAWTGEVVFAWSGRLSKAGTIGVRGSYTKLSIEYLASLQGYEYLDGGYIYNPTSRNMEMIVTDDAPTPRALAGVSGHLADATGARRNLIAIYGGEYKGKPIAEGAIYDVNANAWISMQAPGAPSPRMRPSVHFINDEEVLVWGGLTLTNLGYEMALGDGAIYNIRKHQWRKMSDTFAPSPRHGHVSVWSGGNTPEFVVLGGTRPGDVWLANGARYSPATDTWLPTPSLIRGSVSGFAFAGGVHTRLSGQNNSRGKVIVFGGKSESGGYLRNGFVFDLDSNSMTQNNIALSGPDQVIDFYLRPTLILDGDGSSTEHRLWIITGKASDIASDISPRIVLLQFYNGVVGGDQNISSYTASALGNVLSWSLHKDDQGKSFYTCCEDWLAFRSNNKMHIMNGTVTHDSSVYTHILSGETTTGRVVNATTQTQQSKTFLSFQLEINPENRNMIFTRIDGPREQIDNAVPNGPFNVYNVNKPAFDGANLVFYGGWTTDSIFSNFTMGSWFSADRTGGWVYNIPSRTWKYIPVESAFYSRTNAFSFILNGKFFQWGGQRAQFSAGSWSFPRQYDGVSIDYSAAQVANPTAILTTSAQQQFDFSPVDGWGRTQFNGPGVCKSESKVLMVGGLRNDTRTLAEVDTDRALIQRPVLFDATSSTPSYAYPSLNPLGERHMATVVSTPGGCFIWGGFSAAGTKRVDPNLPNESVTERIARAYSPLSTGFLYQFDTDSWSPITSTNSPSPRSAAHAVWTGDEILLWGGQTAPRFDFDGDANTPPGVWFYSPTTNSWRAVASGEGEPRFRGTERPVWTGKHMFVWKSRDQENIVQYTPMENRWTRLKPPAGFNYGVIPYFDSHVEWLGNRLLVMPSSDTYSLSVMAFYLPLDP